MFILDPWKEIPKKLSKKFKKLNKLFPALFLAKMGWNRRRKGEKIVDPNSVQSRPGQENSVKNIKKQKIKKPLSDIIFSQNGMKQAEKERKKF